MSRNREVHDPGYENVKKVTCDKCGEQFLATHSLQQHVKKGYCKIPGNPSKEVIICDICGPDTNFRYSPLRLFHVQS